MKLFGLGCSSAVQERTENDGRKEVCEGQGLFLPVCLCNWYYWQSFLSLSLAAVSELVDIVS